MEDKKREVRQGEFYKHFKNKIYQIVAIATHSETREKMVVYQALYDDFQVYVRPYDMFTSEVDHVKYPEIEQQYRFEKYDVVTGKDNVVSVDTLKEARTELFTKDKEQVDAEEGEVSPLLLEFLECNTFEDKLDKFVRMKDRLDNRLLNDIAMSLDITVETEDLEDKYEEIKGCLLTFVRFEDNRLR